MTRRSSSRSRGWRPIVVTSFSLSGFRLLIDTHARARLLLVGRGETRARLEQMVAELGLGGHVIFTGYRDADLPSVLAAVGLLRAHGRAARTNRAGQRSRRWPPRVPVIARRVGALPETVVHDETGLLIDDDTPESVARALETILGEPARGRAMGNAGRRQRRGAVQRRALGRDGRARLSEHLVKILQLMSCRGWSSDAYWAARMTRELARRGHVVTLGCRAGTEARVIDRARARGCRARDDPGDGERRAARGGRRRSSPPARAHARGGRGARASRQGALAGRDGESADRDPATHREDRVTSRSRCGLTRRIDGSIAERTAFVVTVTDAIRRQYVAAGPRRSGPCRRAAGRRRHRALSSAPRAIRRPMHGSVGARIVRWSG